MSGSGPVAFLENKRLRLEWRLRQLAWDAGNDLSWTRRGADFRRDWRELARKHVWCFIVGCNNSGTSLLNDIFRRSGEVSTMPAEGQYLTRAMFRLPVRGHERVWSEVLDAVEAELPVLEERMPRLLHDWMRHFSRPLQRVLVEKTPANLIRAVELERCLGDCHFVGMVRDGFAVCEGIRRKAGKSLERGARHWNAINERLLAQSGRVAHFHVVRYEELTSDPDMVLGGLADALGIERGPLLAAGRARFHVGKTVAGAGATGLVNFNELSRAKLDAEDRATILRGAGEMLRRFGYAAPPASPDRP